MSSKRTRFIDKKKAVTYRLVPRSQADPLIGDGDASEYVFVPVGKVDPKYAHLKLPPCVLPTASKGVETIVKRVVEAKGPRPDWDPDVVAALDNGCSYDSDLEDDFMLQAGGEVSEKENVCDKDDFFNMSSDEDDDEKFGERKSRTGFTEYSLTSIRSDYTELEKIQNEKFEQFFLTNYGDDQIGSLEGEEIPGGNWDADSKIVADLIADFEKTKMRYHIDETDSSVKDITLNLAKNVDNEKYVRIPIKMPVLYDCESIISTYSDKYNHPAVIREEKKKLSKRNLKKLERECQSHSSGSEDDSEFNASVMSASTFRPKNETTKERKARKQAVKEIQRENRKIKKMNKVLSQAEAKRLKTAAINARRNPGVRIF